MTWKWLCCYLTIKCCDHSQWLTLCSQSIEIVLYELNRLQTFIDQIFSSDSQYFSFCVFIESTVKSVALYELVFFTRTARVKNWKHYNDVHLYLEVSTVFYERSVLFMKSNLLFCDSKNKIFSVKKCHKTVWQTLFRLWEDILEV